MSRCRLFIGNPGTGKSTLANCIAKRVLFKSGISFGSVMTNNLNIEKHDEIIYLDTPGLADINMRKVAASSITEGLKKNGKYQIFFVITLNAGRLRLDDLVTIWLVLLSVPDIKFVNIIINKLSKREYDFLHNSGGIDKSNLLGPLELLGRDFNCNILLLLHNQMLHDGNDVIANYPELDEFVKEVPWEDVKSSNVGEILGENGSFVDQLSSLADNMDNLLAYRLPTAVRLTYHCFYSFL